MTMFSYIVLGICLYLLLAYITGVLLTVSLDKDRQRLDIDDYYFASIAGFFWPITFWFVILAIFIAHLFERLKKGSRK